MTARRRLLLFSAPVAVLIVIVMAVAISQAGKGILAKSHFSAGIEAVREYRLDDADREFTESLAQAGDADTCPARVNLELVRETLGDRAAAALDGNAAVARYVSAQTAVQQAPDGCFAGNSDPDLDRRALREDAAARIERKLVAARVAPPPAAPPPPTAAAAPPPLGAVGVAPTDPDIRLRLNPGAGDPQDRLQQILRDAAAQAGM